MYSSVYRQPDAFPNVQCVKKKKEKKKPNPWKCVILMIIEPCTNFSPCDTLEPLVERQLVSVTHSVPLLFQCVSRSYTVVTLCLFLEHL